MTVHSDQQSHETRNYTMWAKCSPCTGKASGRTHTVSTVL
jgi:hypothetical protein